MTRTWAALLIVGGHVTSTPAVAPHFDTVQPHRIPRDVVAALARDRDGFLWIATGDGMTRFDGLGLQPVELTQGPSPAERNLGWVRTLLTARDGRVWMGTESRGVALYDPRDEKVRLLEPELAVQPTLRAMAEEADGTVWTGSQGGGLRRYRVSADAVTVAGTWRADGHPGSLPDDRVLALRVDRSGRLWLGSWVGLARREGKGFVDAAPELAGQRVQALHETADGAIWAGSLEGALLRLGPHGQRLVLPPSPAGSVTALTEPVPGELWVGRERGIERRDAASGALLAWLRSAPQQPTGLRGDAITTLLSDDRGVTWVGGLGVGLQRHDSRQQAFTVRGADPDPSSALASANVQALLQRRDGSIWASTSEGRIAVLDEQLDVRGHGPRVPGRVDAMAEAADGRLWLGSAGAVYEFDAKARPLRTLKHAGGLSRRLLAAGDGRLWLAADDGLWVLDAGTNLLRRVAGADGRALAGEVHALAEGADGQVWVGSSTGLWRVPAGAQRALPVQSPPGQGLGSPVVTGLLVDSRDRLWLDTAVSGLHRLSGWSGELARFDRIGERLGASGRPFGVNMLEDEQGRIWTQMQVYDPAADRLTALGQADGVRIGMPWFFAYTALRDGRMLFGGTHGILALQPKAWSGAPARPLLRIAGLSADGQRIPVARARDGLTLPAQTQRLFIDVALLDVAEAERLRYEYRLDGLDDLWQQSLPGQRQIGLLQLKPGHYTLRLRADAGAPEISLPIHVQPAWWQTRWSWAGGALLLVGSFLALLQWRTRSLRARQRELEQRVRERTQALEEASLTDPLTGLRNRRYLLERIEADCAAAMRRAGRNDADLLFFLIDVDHFKALNDRHGHAAGDAVLAQMRERLQHVFRAGDSLVRWGGEEFLAVARDSDREHAGELAERLRQQVAERPFDSPAGPLAITVSIGFAVFPPWPSQPTAFGWQDTLAAADQSLYAAKAAGRNRWQGLVQLDALDVDAAHEALRTGLGAGRWMRSTAPG